MPTFMRHVAFFKHITEKFPSVCVPNLAGAVATGPAGFAFLMQHDVSVCRSKPSYRTPKGAPSPTGPAEVLSGVAMGDKAIVQAQNRV